jgi:hypothetical protein
VLCVGRVSRPQVWLRAVRTRNTGEVNAALIEFLRGWQWSAMISNRFCDFVFMGLHGMTASDAISVVPGASFK